MTAVGPAKEVAAVSAVDVHGPGGFNDGIHKAPGRDSLSFCDAQPRDFPLPSG